MIDGVGVWKSQVGEGPREALEACEERREEEPSLMRSLALTLIFGELAGLPE